MSKEHSAPAPRNALWTHTDNVLDLSTLMEHPRPDALPPAPPAPVPALPIEIWEAILAFLRPYEEYQAAVVCRDWYAITVRRREKRGEKTWRTWMGVFCNTVPRLQWARANGCPWGKGTCKAAAEGGHLQVLQWARANGSPWEKRTCHYAAREGHLEVLQWARENGCPWEKGVCLLFTPQNIREWVEAQPSG